MKVINTIQGIKSFVKSAQKSGKTIGFIPTMGALHQGHASLVSCSVKENDITIVSDFVNPTQFNNPKDLKKYPRSFDADCALLESLKVSCVFAPSVAEMYPEEDKRHFSYPPIDTVMEAPRRPGHFNGVCQIVSKLFAIINPDRAYFGEKDFQQIAVIKAMVKDLKFPLIICPCPIVREESGLALSSRNVLLTDDERAIAVNIFKILKESLKYAEGHTVEETKKWVVAQINAIDILSVEYYEIVDGDSLQNIEDWNSSDYIVGCVTVYCGAIPVRLIDNIKYKA